MNTYQFKRIRSVFALFALFALDFKPEYDCLLHPFKQLVNLFSLGMTARKAGNTPNVITVFIFLDDNSVFSHWILP